MDGFSQKRKMFFLNKRILVTGGTGSIGEKIVEALLEFNPKEIVVLARDDSKLYLMEKKHNKQNNIRYLLGDIREYSCLEQATEGVDIVFHTAALKQVPICEENPFEAVKTNVIGSENLIKAAIFNKVKKVINISTDKAVNPTNTMGTTKLLAEKLFYHANFINNSNTLFSSVRFGNVIGSRGSVIPIFLEQAKKGEDLTITDPRMTRFFMTIPEAIDLLFYASYLAKGGETFIFKMNALKITDLIAVIQSYSALKGLKRPKIRVTGIRPGEKLYEELISAAEKDSVLENDRLYLITKSRLVKHYPGFKAVELISYRSDQVEKIPQEKILSLLESLDIFPKGRRES